MPVQNVECQIAQLQLGRYLAGDRFTPEARQQLEAHLTSCPHCRAVVETKTQGKVPTPLQPKPAATPTPKPTAPAHPASAPNPADPPASAAAVDFAALLAKAQKIAAAAQTSEKAQPETPKPTPQPSGKAVSWKPLAYSGALAAVLIGMSVFAKNPTGLLGPRVAEAKISGPTDASPAANSMGGPLAPDAATTSDRPLVVVQEPVEPRRRGAATTVAQTPTPQTPTLQTPAQAPAAAPTPAAPAQISVPNPEAGTAATPAQPGTSPVSPTAPAPTPTAAKAATSDPPAASDQSQPRRAKPNRRAPRASANRSSGGLRVYLPDGTPKN